LVLEDIGPEANYAAIERIEKLLSLVPVPFHSRAEAKDFFENKYAQKISFYPQAETVARFFLSNIEQKPDGTQDWRFAKDAILKSMMDGRNEDRWDAWSNLKMPTLVIRGEHSPDLPRPVYDRMLATLPSAKGVEIPGSGHWVHFEQTAAFIRVLKEFFHETLGTARAGPPIMGDEFD
jgi:pimeloyl-ACP methyl ester carboxylesterase